jgi:hypothetical protein
MNTCIKCQIETEVLIDDLCPDCKREQSINDQSIKKWIILWQFNRRIGSFQLNDSNWQLIKETFIYEPIQIDVTGSIHLDVLGMIDN